jgi:8-oxo-dGTP pyrophosphatase MutT (NUDIX family)
MILETRLRAALRGPLPGAAAQARMAPAPRPGWDPAQGAPAGRPAAVLVLFYPDDAGRETLVYTERTPEVARHRGQVSFPGGVIDPGETAEQAALREAHEEVGLAPDVARVLGSLTPLWVPATGFTIHPIVAVADARPVFTPNPREVRRVIETTLAHLLDPVTVRVEPSMMDGRWVRVPYFDLDGTRLWGASAMVTAECLALLGWPGPQPS